MLKKSKNHHEKFGEPPLDFPLKLLNLLHLPSLNLNIFNITGSLQTCNQNKEANDLQKQRNLLQGNIQVSPLPGTLQNRPPSPSVQLHVGRLFSSSTTHVPPFIQGKLVHGSTGKTG